MLYKESHLILHWVTPKRDLKNRKWKIQDYSQLSRWSPQDSQTYFLPVLEQPLPGTQTLPVTISRVLSQLFSLSRVSLSTFTNQCPHHHPFPPFSENTRECLQGPQKPSLKPDHKDRDPGQEFAQPSPVTHFLITSSPAIRFCRHR